MADPPRLLIIAGPNGSDKTTFASRHLQTYPENIEFVNTDEIARRLSPDDVNRAAVEAAREALLQINELFESRVSFAVETTLSGHRHHRLANHAKQQGWIVDMAYLWIGSATLAKRRGEDRVKLGGHWVAPKDIERRF